MGGRFSCSRHSFVTCNSLSRPEAHDISLSVFACLIESPLSRSCQVAMLMRLHGYNFAHISRSCNLTESSLFLWLFDSFFPLFCDVSLGSFFFAYRSIYCSDIATGHCHLKSSHPRTRHRGRKKRRGRGRTARRRSL